jgi:hypothetical protein
MFYDFFTLTSRLRRGGQVQKQFAELPAVLPKLLLLLQRDEDAKVRAKSLSALSALLATDKAMDEFTRLDGWHILVLRRSSPVE